MALAYIRDGGWGWVVVGGSCLNHFLFEGLVRSYGLLYLVLQSKFMATAATTAWLQASFNAVAMAIGPLVGLLVERVSCRALVITGGLLACGSLLLSAYTPNIYFLFFSYSFIGGCGGGLVYSPMVLIISEYFEEKRGKALGFAAVGGAVGTATMPLFLGYLLHNFDYSATLIILAGTVLHHCVSGMLYKPLPRKTKCRQFIFGSMESVHKQTQSNNGDTFVGISNEHSIHTSQLSLDIHTGNSSDQHEKKQNVLCLPANLTPQSSKHVNLNASIDFREEAELNAPFRVNSSPDFNSRKSKQNALTKIKLSHLGNKVTLLKNVSFLLFCFNFFNIPTTIISTFIFLPGLAEEFGISDVKAPLLVAIIGACSGFGRITFGFLFDLSLIKKHRRLFHSVLGVFLGLSTASIALCEDFVSVALVAAVIGLSEGGVMAQRATALSQYVNPEQLAFAFGILTMFQGLGNLLGPLLQGHLKDTLGTYTICFYYGGGVTFLSSLLLVVDYLGRRRPMSHGEDWRNET